MPRPPRFTPPGLPQHLIQRGNNRQACFAGNDDKAAYAHWLTEYSAKYEVAVHAWVFMTNHVHLLVTPNSSSGISAMMQSLGRVYVSYFNRKQQRSGTLWEGRFRSCVIDTDRYLLECYRYIELNPVRAGMVETPAEYHWSSYQCNALGKESRLLTPHLLYTELGRTAEERMQAYRALFEQEQKPPVVAALRHAIHSRGLTRH